MPFYSTPCFTSLIPSTTHTPSLDPHPNLCAEKQSMWEWWYQNSPSQHPSSAVCIICETTMPQCFSALSSTSSIGDVSTLVSSPDAIGPGCQDPEGETMVHTQRTKRPCPVLWYNTICSPVFTYTLYSLCDQLTYYYLVTTTISELQEL